jgi:hypothetical protein
VKRVSKTWCYRVRQCVVTVADVIDVAKAKAARDAVDVGVYR